MGRQASIARSIATALTGKPDESDSRHVLHRLLSTFTLIFALYRLPMFKIRGELFTKLRSLWQTEESVYLQSFQVKADEQPEDSLHPIGDMGYSGSTFFDTRDKRFLVKSVPRHFEHSFFRDDLLEPYSEHMTNHPHSLLVRICDFLAAPYVCLGSIFGLAPTHHIIMENILLGKESAESKDNGREWESWDLKPQSYFFPERDIANGKLASEATKSRLADEFHDKIVLTQQQADDFFVSLEEDTKLLADCNAVDYSLFLIRISPPVEEDPFTDPLEAKDIIPVDPPSVPPSPPSWRTGIPSADAEKRYVYRAAILDFFWAKHKTQPRVMTALINLWNLLVSRHGHMSITTTPREYRDRFINMCKDIVEVRERGQAVGN